MNRRDFIRAAALAAAGQSLAAGPARPGERIKVVQFGVTHEHAGGKIATLRKLADIYDIVGYVDDRATSPVRFIDEGLKPYEGLRKLTAEEAFATPGLRLAMVEVSNPYLLDMAFECLRHNLAMHMDKPPTENLARYRALLAGCRERGLPFQMGYMFRGNPAIQFCVKAVRDGLLGEIDEVRADMTHNYGCLRYQEYLSHFRGGIMYNLGCHLIDFIVAMLGRPERVTPFLRDTAGAVASAKNNCAAVLEYPHTLVMLSAADRELTGANPRELVITGSKGTAVLAPLEEIGTGRPVRVKLELKKAEGSYKAGMQEIKFPLVADRYETQLRELARVIRGEIPQPDTWEHDAETLEVTLAASGVLKL